MKQKNFAFIQEEVKCSTVAFVGHSAGGKEMLLDGGCKLRIVEWTSIALVGTAGGQLGNH